MNRSNNIWVKKMCQKLEDICTDIDKFVCTEPVSFVGNQMETVGANVKNFFSGVVNDFGLTQVVNPVHVDLVENSTTSVVDVKENTVDSNTNNPKEAPLVLEELCHEPSSTDFLHSEQITYEIRQHLIGDNESQINGTSDNTTQVNLNTSTNIQTIDTTSEERVCYDESLHSDAAALEYSDWGTENIIDLNLDTGNMTEGEPLMNLEDKKALLNSPVDEPECDSNTSTTHQSSELESSVPCNENLEENSKHIIAGGLSFENTYKSLNSSFRNFNVEPDTIDCKPTETVDYFSVLSDSISSCESFTTIACDSGNEADVSCSGTGLADGSTVDFYDIKFDSVESGVIVEGGKLSLFPKTSRSKSYKKMIQDAFMSRKRLTKEYKQLAIRYGDIDKELWQPIERSKPPVHDLPDSEWELL